MTSSIPVHATATALPHLRNLDDLLQVSVLVEPAKTARHRTGIGERLADLEADHGTGQGIHVLDPSQKSSQRSIGLGPIEVVSVDHSKWTLDLRPGGEEGLTEQNGNIPHRGGDETLEVR